MKRGFQIALALSVFAASPRVVTAAEMAATSTNQHERVSYSLGMYIAHDLLKRYEFNVDIDIMAQGVKDVMAGRELKIPHPEAREILTAYQQELRAKHEQERMALAEKNRAAGDAFLASNREKPDVKTHQVPVPSNLSQGSTNASPTAELQYKVIAEGSGQSPSAGATVAYRVRGTTTTGTEFENSTTQPEPARASLSRVSVVGLREALKMMKPGAKWQIFVPSSLAYGDFGTPNLEPGSTLIYDVELVSVQEPEPLTSDIIKVPSAEELARGAQIEVIKAEDLKKMQQTNAAAGGQ